MSESHSSPRPRRLGRRAFLQRSAAAAGAAALPLTVFARRVAGEGKAVRRGEAGYGPLFPTRDLATGLPLLMLPEGFRYLSFGWTRDVMDDGRVTPNLHDGMAAFDHGNGRVLLVRNHETGNGPAFFPVAYDSAGGAGGTTTIEFDVHRGAFVGSWSSLAGTIRNCAGGTTPWGSWLTCEETTTQTTMPHGYVFEVPADGIGNPVPLRDMGRFSHEAVCVDPATGYVYETEDTGDAGFYRFVPHVPGDLTQGGQLLMLAIKGQPMASIKTGTTQGQTWEVEWVPIAQPDSTNPIPGNFVWAQGRALGGAAFARLEGCWWGNGRAYIVSTSGGVGQGQVFEYNPREETLHLLFQSPGADVLNAPDNICVSPRGGLVLCEDGGGQEFIHGLTTEGEIFRFVQNTVVLNGERNGFSGDFSGSEFAGACFSPDGRWLFFNIQSPGITFAVTGPWGQKGI